MKKPASKRKPPRTNQQAIAETRAALNRVQAVKLRIQGKTLREIGEALGVHHGTVAEYIKAELESERKLGARERKMLRDIERARLERVLCQVLPFIENEALTIETQRGNNIVTVERFQAVMKGADTVVKISARLSALDGLDAPVKQEHSGTINVEGVATIRARMAKRRAGG